MPQPARTPDIQDALNLHRQGRLLEAEELYAAVLAADPGHFDALHFLGVLNHQQGRAAEALRLIASALKRNPRSADALSNYGLVLGEFKRHAEALAAFDQALALKRDHANALNNRGLALAALGRAAAAQASWERAVAADPQHAEALHNLGNALYAGKRLDEALAVYGRALKVRPHNLDVLNNRGGVLAELGRIDEAIECYDRLLALDPALGEVHINKGHALAELHRFDAALGSYATAAATERMRAEARWAESLVRLRLGQFRDGWRGYEWRWQQASWADRRRNFAQPLWLGEGRLDGKTILLHGEQGFGDTLQFVRYLPMVAALGGTIMLEVQPPLAPLLANFPGVARTLAHGEALPAFDLHCPLMSLPLAFGTEPQAIPAQVPYLGVPEAKLVQWRSRLGERRRPRVGIVWGGRASHKNDHNRSIALARLAPLLGASGIDFVSLQKEPSAADAARLGHHHPKVRHLGEELADFADTAAVVALLDLVIAVDTSVVHLAGALGRPVWVLLPFTPDFRWLLGRPDSPWYPSARLFRQERRGDWGSVIERVRGELGRSAPWIK